MCLSASIQKQVDAGMREVCSETSELHPGISFHVRYEQRIWGHGSDVRAHTTNYIEGTYLSVSLYLCCLLICCSQMHILINAHVTIIL
mgnify:CR=1 FL=1